MYLIRGFFQLVANHNKEKTVGNRFLRLAVLGILVGVSMGIFMAASHNYTLRPVHAHLNLLG